MDFEKQAGAASREDFASNEEQVAAKKAAIAEAAAAGDYDKVAELAQAAKGLETSKNEMMSNTEDAARAENAERDAAAKKEGDHVEALEMNKAFDESQAAEKAAQERAKIAEADKLSAEADAAAAAKLAEQIKSGNVGVEVQSAEVVQDKPIGNTFEAPKNETFEKYGEKMRGAAAELVNVKKQMQANEKIMYSKELDMAERLKAQDENKALNETRNKLREDALFGAEFRRQKTGESYSEYSDYQRKTLDEYRDAAMQDPQTVLSMLESGELGNGYREGEGVGQISEELRENPEFMAKALELLPNGRAAENFWVHVKGEARNNSELYIAAVKKNHLNYQWGSKEWKTDPEIQKIALESGLDPMYLQQN